MNVFSQGIIGDPGIQGRDGDPGIEVLHSADNDILMVNFRSSVLLYVSCISSQAYQGPQGLSGKLGRSGAKVLNFELVWFCK